VEREPVQLQRLRGWRNRRGRDLTLAGLAEQVNRTVIRPHKQVAGLAVLWRELVPAALLERTALASFARGVLTVEVPDSTTLYEIDRLLRGGLERQLRAASTMPLRRVRCRVAGLAHQ
jgi:hypothetical protein